MIHSQTIRTQLALLTRKWDPDRAVFQSKGKAGGLEVLIHQLHFYNFTIWHLENDVRKPKNQDWETVGFKRQIDDANYKRNRMMETIDDSVVRQLNLGYRRDYDGFVLNSETIGQMIDRLSILTLKSFYMEKQAARQDLAQAISQQCRTSQMTLEVQLDYISSCFDQFVERLANGKAYMLAYKQFKFYKDQDLVTEINPS